MDLALYSRSTDKQSQAEQRLGARPMAAAARSRGRCMYDLHLTAFYSHQHLRLLHSPLVYNTRRDAAIAVPQDVHTHT